MNPVLAAAGLLLPVLLLADAGSGTGFAAAPGMTPEEAAEFAELEAFFLGPRTGPSSPSHPEDRLPALSDWHWLTSVSVGAGYDDNPLREEIPAGSAFLHPQVEAFGSWLPRSPLKATFFGFYESRVFARSGMEAEHLAAIHATTEADQWGWRWEGAADVFFARQIYDATLLRTSPTRTAGLLTQFQPRVTFAARRTMNTGWYIRPALAFGRSVFREIDEDFWLYRAELRVGRDFPGGTTLEVFTAAVREAYLDASARERRGLRLPGERLRIDTWTAGTRASLHFGGDRQWRLSLEFSANLEDDHAGNYYEAWRWRTAPEIRWKRGNWDVAARIVFARTEFSERLPSFISTDQEWHQRVSGNLGIDYKWSARWSSLLRFDYNELEANRLTLRYRQRSATASCTFHF